MRQPSSVPNIPPGPTRQQLLHSRPFRITRPFADATLYDSNGGCIDVGGTHVPLLRECHATVRGCGASMIYWNAKALTALTFRNSACPLQLPQVIAVMCAGAGVFQGAGGERGGGGAAPQGCRRGRCGGAGPPGGRQPRPDLPLLPPCSATGPPSATVNGLGTHVFMFLCLFLLPAAPLCCLREPWAARPPWQG